MSASHTSFVRPSRRKPLAACMAAVFALSAPATALAAVWHVTNCVDDGSTGSLRWAATGAVSGDTIDMTGLTGAVLSGLSCEKNHDGFAYALVVYNGTLNIAGGVTIKGPNTTSTKTLAVGGAGPTPSSSVFRSSGYLKIKDLGIKYGKNTTTSGSGEVYGGCVYAHSGVYLNDVILDHCTAYTTAANTAAKGGAVGVFDGPITLIDSVVTNSAATSHTSGAALGGGLYTFGSVNLTYSAIVYSTATATSGNAHGGAVMALAETSNSGNITMSASFVEDSAAYANGNAGGAAGGGIYAYGKVQFSDNSSVEDSVAYDRGATGGRARGGGIFAKQGAYLSSGSFTADTLAATSSSANALGGGIYSGAYVTLANGEVSGGEASSYSGNAYGGGIFSVGGTTARYSVVWYSYGLAHVSEGGGIYSKGGVEFKYGLVRSNAATEGGGIGVGAGDLYLRGVTLTGNYALSSSYAGSDASAVGMFSGGTGSTATIVNSTISGNTVGSTSGKYAVFIDAYTTKLFNSTIAYNTGGEAPGTFITGVTNSKAGLYSTLMSSNSYSNGTQNDFSKSTNVTFEASSSNNLIRHPGTGVPAGTLTGTSACPFLHPLTYSGGLTATHRLGGGSGSKNPAIDTGSNPKGLTSDQRGGSLSAASPARVSGSAADIGAYEVQQNDILFDAEFETCPN